MTPNEFYLRKTLKQASESSIIEILNYLNAEGFKPYYDHIITNAKNNNQTNGTLFVTDSSVCSIYAYNTDYSEYGVNIEVSKEVNGMREHILIDLMKDSFRISIQHYKDGIRKSHRLVYQNQKLTYLEISPNSKEIFDKKFSSLEELQDEFINQRTLLKTSLKILEEKIIAKRITGAIETGNHYENK